VSDALLQLGDHDEAQALFGPRDRFVRSIRERFGVEIVLRGLTVEVSGAAADRAAALALLTELLERVRRDGELTTEVVDQALDRARSVPGTVRERGASGVGEVPTRIEGIRLRTDGQRHYVKTIESSDITFAVGPAGTGKTYLAVLMAVQALKQGKARRIVLCRPAVEAGEKLGYLPGDFQAKVNPYMRPLYDALYGMIDFDTVKKYIEREVIEVAPLAFMRGRTLDEAFIILDEAQNTTRSQMKMFLTRMGESSKIVVTGDTSQVDLPPGVTSGLVHALSILKGIKGIGVVELSVKDIVRHQVVWKIIEAYDGRPARRKRRG
jgi:phosphate starvation-inducible PhoH-like protein